MKFSELNLIPELQKALNDAGYSEPTPIQERAIPPLLGGRDLLGLAQTGTGKTAAFAVPILQLLQQNKKPAGGKRSIQALVVTPTRELALQIQESFLLYGKYLPLRSAVIFGGVSQVPQVQELARGVDVLVATPGRLNDLCEQGLLHLESARILVLDEADRMLDMGFVRDVKKIIARLKNRSQTMLFSATMPPEIRELVGSILHNPVRAEVTPPATTAERIEQSVYFVDKANKRRLLADLLRGDSIVSALVFTRTKHGADRVVRELSREKIPAQAIHGNKSQGARQQALSNFKSGKTRVLVATDIAARGIDIEELSHVINYNLPNIPETYVHRIGRTGRAGLAGTAISFCEYEEIPYLREIEKLTRQKIPVVENHPYPMEIFEVPPRAEPPARGGQRGPKNAGSAESKAAAQSGARQKPGRAERKPKPAGPAASEKPMETLRTSTQPGKAKPAGGKAGPHEAQFQRKTEPGLKKAETLLDSFADEAQGKKTKPAPENRFLFRHPNVRHRPPRRGGVDVKK